MFKKVILTTIFSLSSILAYSYTAFPPMTQKDAIAINPALFMDDNNSGGSETFLYYGMTDKIDLCTSILTVNGYSNFSVMFRYGWKEITAGIRANTSWSIPQLTYTFENNKFYFQTCYAAQISYDYPTKPSLFGIFCPGYKFSDKFNIGCDINPGYYLQDGDFANLALREKGFGLDIAPSVGIQVGECCFSFALPLYNIQKETIITFGAWIYYQIKNN